MESKAHQQERSKIFSANLQKERLRQGLTAKQVADIAGVSYSHYRNVEAGNGYFPSFMMFLDLINALRVAPARLLNGIVEQNELNEYKGMSERFAKLKPQQLAKVNRMIDLLFE